MTDRAFYTLTQLFSTSCGVIVSISVYKLRNVGVQYKYLYIYPIASFLQNIFALIINSTFLHADKKASIISISIYAFLIIEFYSLYYYFVKSLKYNKSRKILSFYRVLYPILVLACWMPGINPNTSKYLLYLIQGSLLLVPCTFFVLEQFKYPTQTEALKSPSFWITVGISFYFACTLPLFIMKDFVFHPFGGITDVGIHSINQLCYGIMFLLMLKGFKCNNQVIS